MTTSKIYLELADDIQELLDGNGISLPQALAEEGIDVTVSRERRPFDQEAGAQSKDVVQVLVAGATAVAVGYALSTVINSITHRPRLVEICELQELRDSQGELVLGADGKPMFKTVKQIELLEPRATARSQEIELSTKPDAGFVIRIKSAESPKVPSGAEK